MIEENYLIIENNIVTNIVYWNGDTTVWQPPEGAITLAQSKVPANVMVITGDDISNNVQAKLTEVMGVGEIGFVWNGTVLNPPS